MPTAPSTLLVRYVHSSHTTHRAGESFFLENTKRQHQQIQETSEVTVRGYWAGKTWPYLFLNITNQSGISRSSQCHRELLRSAQTRWPGCSLTNTALAFWQQADSGSKATTPRQTAKGCQHRHRSSAQHFWVPTPWPKSRESTDPLWRATRCSCFPAPGADTLQEDKQV